jgi:hypothetical protein
VSLLSAKQRELIRTAVLAVLVSVFAAGAAPAQQTSTDRMALDWRACMDDAEAVFTAPLHWNAGQWAVAALVAASTAAAYTQDETVRDGLAGPRASGIPEPWNAVGDYYGSGIVGGVTGAAMYAGGLAFDDEWTRVTGRMVLQSISYAAAANYLLKMLLGRARPYTGEGPSAFHFFRTDNAHLSLPSGHATQAFALSSTLAARIGSPFASAGLYGLALITVSQRLITDMHWFSDTVLGSAMGVAIGLAVVHLEEQRVSSGDAAPPPVAVMHPHQPLLSWTLQF